MESPSLAAMEVIKMTSFNAASDENVTKMTIFSFQCEWCARWPPQWVTKGVSEAPGSRFQTAWFQLMKQFINNCHLPNCQCK